ncbi:MAG TPA: hypothetical protein VGK03_06915 [Geothrix sp.]
MSRHLTAALTSIAALAPQAGMAAPSSLPPQPTSGPSTPEVQRAQISSLTLYLSLPDGSTTSHGLDPAKTDAIYWSDRSVEVLASYYGTGKPDSSLDADTVRRSWNSIGADGYLPAFLTTGGSSNAELIESRVLSDRPVTMGGAQYGMRPKLTGMVLAMSYPNGHQRIHTIDALSDALSWSDRSIAVLGSFYAPGGPAEGKRMRREDILTFFPNAGVLIGDQQEVLITPEWINAIWNHPKSAGVTPAFLVKSMMNPVNG